MTDQKQNTSPLRDAIRWLRSPSTSTPRSASAPAQPGTESLFLR